MAQQLYDIRQEEDGTWTVFDVETQTPVVLNGKPQIGLDIQDADDIAESLDRISDLTTGVAAGRWADARHRPTCASLRWSQRRSLRGGFASSPWVRPRT